MRVLFISRAFPPVIGGIEKQNFEIWKALSAITDVEKISNPYGKKTLLPFLIVALCRAFLLRNRYDVVLLGDGVLSILTFIFKIFSKKPVVCIVHGLDITYSNFVYRKFWVNIFFRKTNKFIAVGNETIRQAALRNINTDNFEFVPNGVDISQPQTGYTREDLGKLLGFNPVGPVLLTLGRLVKRKGVLWFVENVIPSLDASITYLVAGDGDDKESIIKSVQELKLDNRVKILGQVNEEEKKILLSTVDIFIQPNIKVENDIEGFGLVVLEAALHARAVIASRLEGLQDAVSENHNGILLDPENADAYIETIENLLKNPTELEKMGQRARDFVKQHYDWQKIARRYYNILDNEYSSWLIRK